jgi:transposase-like protein
MEKEINNRINFLDITINKEINIFSFNISRKPTTTDVIIPQDSCHPHEHKQAAIRYMLNRVNTYNLNYDNKRAELNTIKQIISNNGYNNSTIQQLDRPTTKPSPNNNNNTWARFKYIGKQTKFNTKLFKETPVRIAHTTNNSISRHLSKKPNTPQPARQYEKSGIYQLTCPDCHKRYIGQTGRSFQKRYQEHFHDYKFNKCKSKYATHLLENYHSIGPIHETMQILYTTSKVRLMDTIEKFHICKGTQQNNQINDRDTVKYSAIFDTIVHPTAYRAPTNPLPIQGQGNS